MKKKIAIAGILIVAFIFLIPIPNYLKDGGTVEYKALLYKVSKVHSLTLQEEMESGKRYHEGIKIEILGFEVFSNVS